MYGNAGRLNMRILIICILGIITFFSVMANVVFVMTLWSSQANAAETGNLLSDNFADGTWSGTNLQSRHGDNVIAGVDNQYVESQITLSDHLLTPEINTGFTATLDGDVWIWNDYQQSVTSTLKIVSDSDEVTEQNITLSGTCSTWNNCSYGSMGSNTIIIGDNDNLDYTITSTFSFSVPNTTGHAGADLRNPSLNITYDEYVVEIPSIDMKFDSFDFKEEDLNFAFEDEFKTDNMFEEFIEVKDDVFFYEEDSWNLDSKEFDDKTFDNQEFDEKEMPMESYEDAQFDEQFKESDTVFQEDVKDEPFDEEQQFVEEEVFFDEEQDVEFIEEQPQDIEIAEQEEQSVEVQATFEDIIVAQVDTINVIINTQPTIIDRQDFYVSEPIYTNQVDISDNRQLYENVVFNVFDPVLEYENKVKENKRKQEQLMKELNKWSN